MTFLLAFALSSVLNSFVGSQTAPAWIGYTVPVIAGERVGCNSSDFRSKKLSLEGAASMYVLYRVEQKKIGKVVFASTDCEIDSGSLKVTWLQNVVPAESVAFLESLIGTMGEPVMAAIAFHKDAAADRALDSIADNGSDELRRKAIFWLGHMRGRHGFEKLSGILRSNASDKLREHVIFSLTQSKDPDAIPAIVRAAHEDKSAHVRGQALFWLAQSAQKKLAFDTIAHAASSDPDTEVKKRAVFALTQMPNNEGVPKLIELAKSNGNPEVRKQAIFWLGQSHDPRALRFIEDVVTR